MLRIVSRRCVFGLLPARRARGRGLLLPAGAIILILLASCSSPEYDQGVITAEHTSLRSTTARVATISGEVKRGDLVWILNQHSPWVKIRTMTPRPVEGWIDERTVVPQKLVAESRKLQRDVEGLPAQAVGRLKVDSRLRLKPIREDDEANVVQVLRARTTFEILEKQRAPRPVVVGQDSDETPDTAQGTELTKYDTWYKVRLPREYVCRVGWLLGGASELAVPPEIQSFESGLRRFVGWQEVGVVQDSESGEVHNYIVFEKQIYGADPQIDFDRVYGVGWDADDHAYYSFFVEAGIRGLFPVMRRTAGSYVILTLKVIDRIGRQSTVELHVARDRSGRLHIEKGKPVPSQP